MIRHLPTRAWGALGAALLLSVTAHSATVKRYDARTNIADEGRYVVLLSLPESEGSVTGDTFVLLGRGSYPDDFKAEASFGMTYIDGAPKIGTVPAKHGAAVRAADRTAAFVVGIDKDQYESSRDLFAQWSKKDSFLDEPDIEALNFCGILVKRLGMKQPFRPMLSRANPHVYFDDVSKLNRDK